MYIYICTYIHIYTYIYIHSIYAQYTYSHYTHRYIQYIKQRGVEEHAYICIHMYVCISVYTYACIIRMYACMYECMYIRKSTHTHHAEPVEGVYIYTYIHIYIYTIYIYTIYICIHLYICMYIIYICIHMYVCKCVYTRKHTHTHHAEPVEGVACSRKTKQMGLKICGCIHASQSSASLPAAYTRGLVRGLVSATCYMC